MSTEEEAVTMNEMVPCDVCGKMVPEANLTIHRLHACRGVARSSTREDTAAVAEISDSTTNEEDDDDDDVIDLSADSPQKGRKHSQDEAPSSQPPRRRQRRGRPKRDDDDEVEEVDDSMEIDEEEEDDDDDEVEIVENPNPEIVDLLADDDDDEWACSQCTLINDKSRSICEACGKRNPAFASARDSDGIRAADPVRRERLIDDDDYFSAYSSGGGAGSSPMSMMGGGALAGALLGGAGAYMRGRSVGSGMFEGGVAGAVSGAFAHEVFRSSDRPRRRSQYDNPLAEARSAGANGLPAYPVMSSGRRSSARQPRASIRVVSQPGPDGTSTTIVSSSRNGTTRFVRRSQHSHSGHDPVMSLMLHSMMQGNAGSHFGGMGGDAVDRMSYEQLLAAFGDGTENQGASVGAISSLPTARVKTKADGSIDLPSEALECSICLEEFEKGQERKTLPCLHGFHSTCVDKWLQTNGACPVCKFRVDEGSS